MDKAHAEGNILMGFLQWFPIGNKKLVEEAVADLKTLGCNYLRTGFSWADWEDESRSNEAQMTGREWYAWLYPLLKKEGFDILPNFLYVPIGKARPDAKGERRTSHVPTRLEDYAEFVAEAIGAHGDCFTYVELLNEPHLQQEWNTELDPDYSLYIRTINLGAAAARSLGKKVVLGDTTPEKFDWLLTLVDRGLLENVDVVGFHAFPYFSWGHMHSENSIAEYAADFKIALAARGFSGELWLTETGFPSKSDPAFSEERQLELFCELLDQNTISRIFWWSLRDLDPHLPSYAESQIGFREELMYHFGIKTWDGTPKLIFSKIESGEIKLH